MGAPWDWSTLHGQNSPTSSSSTSSPSPTRSSTTTSKDDFAHTPSLTPSTAIPQSHGNGGAWPSSTGSADPANVSNLSKSPESDNDSNSMPLPHIVVAALLPVVFLTILGVILFFYLRRRRRQKAHTQVREMKTQTSGNYPRPAYAVPPVLPPPAGSPIAPQPVILGPIVPGSNGAYYTGIDTSDIISMHDTTGTGNPFVDQSDPHDEPPPPYRPRSIAATISRNTSLRQAQPAALSETNLMAAQGQGPRSPFADPHDDAISEFSEPTRRRFGRRNEDELSAVSDISYQQEPVIVRPTV
ncbi:hypothetical protein AOQ84DRAFT_360546 [Glonium stellatum]|uniref:Uncharacterized protein n=1 Tax=Glonium stellatum TaxID=574774 RepID=A0A8E2JWT8_9PEZI|nr:hypothetical protein AOQ84DRAFT_360546 [Glonium stellatum]